jgi:nitrite reductase/ring-hydroxylating ferredoxin subunit
LRRQPDTPVIGEERNRPCPRPSPLVNLDGSHYAAEELCPHPGAALSQGGLHKEYVECPLHESTFNVKTGKVMTPPALARSPKTPPVPLRVKVQVRLFIT